MPGSRLFVLSAALAEAALASRYLGTARVEWQAGAGWSNSRCDRNSPAMTSSKTIAQLVGPTLVAVTLSEALHLRIWATNIAPVTYLNGFVLFVAGLAIVRVHNRWRRGWPILVTLVGWGSLLGGLGRMLAPEARQGGENTPTYFVIAILFAIGVFLTVKGYRRETQ